MKKATPWLLITILSAGLTLAAQDEQAAVEAEPETTAEAAGEEKSSRLVGSTRTGRRKWVAGVTVAARPEDGGPTMWLTSTDQKGRFRLDPMPAGRYRLEFAKFGLEPLVKGGVDVRHPFQSVVEVLMQPVGGAGASESAAAPEGNAGRSAANLRGRVTDDQGFPESDVRVRLVRDDGSVDPRQSLTAEDGEFLFEDLAAGRWQLEVLAAGRVPLRAALKLEEDLELVAVVVNQPATYRPEPVDLMPVERPLPPADASEKSQDDRLTAK